MKHILILLVLISGVSIVGAQSPVKLSYSAKKITAGTYEVHITAQIEDNWHLYAQNSDEKGGRPAEISFVKNPLITLSGAVKEVGRLESRFEELFGVTVKYYETQVDFVQVIKVKDNITTNIAGAITYMVCTDQKCMPPTTKKFSIQIR